MVLKIYIRMEENINQYNIDAYSMEAATKSLSAYLYRREDVAIFLTFHCKKVS